MEKDILHLISHTHWDREWYMSSKYTNQWLIPFFENLVKLMERDKEYVFVLDGQTILLDDYYDELKKTGRSTTKIHKQISKFVKEGRLLIGPLYLQCDWHLVSEESITRNFLIGSKMAKFFGNRLNSAWLLDNFGQISQLPQIFKQACIESSFIWRGIEMDPKEIKSEFIWEGSDTSKINCVFLLNSFRNAMDLAKYRNAMEERLERLHSDLKEYSTGKNLVLLNGYEQEISQDDILPYINKEQQDTSKYKVIQSSPEKFIEHVFKSNEEKVFKKLKGELNSGKLVCVFPGVLSSRAYLKRQNYLSEKFIEKKLEPLVVMNWLSGSNYPKNLIEQSWKYLMKNHPHDSICGVSVDEVHKNMEDRSFLVDNLTSTELQRTINDLAKKIDTSCLKNKKGFVIFNPSLHPRDFIISGIDGGIIKQVPALGYKTYHKADIPINILKVSENTVENTKIKLNINDNGSYDIFCKETLNNYKNLGIIQSGGECGDLYSSSSPLIDSIISSENYKANIIFKEISPHEIKIKISIDLDIPESLDDSKEKRSKKTIKLPIVTTLTINANSAIVKVKTDLRNTVKDHILKVLFPTNLDTDSSFGGSQFDVVKRTHFKKEKELLFSNKLDYVLNGANEPGVKKIFPKREFLDITDKEKGLSIFSKGINSYNFIKENSTVSLILFRSVGCISQQVRERNGTAGPEILTPHGQCVRQMQFEYAIYPHKGNYEVGEVLRAVEEYTTDPIIIEIEKNKGELPSTNGFIEISDKKNQIKTSGIKVSEDQSGVVIRCYNPTDGSVVANLKSSLDIKMIYLSNLLEENINFINVKSIKFKPKEIKTIKVIFEKEKIINEHKELLILEDRDIEDFSSYSEVDLVTLDEINEELNKSNSIGNLENPKNQKKKIETYFSHLYVKKAYEEKQMTKLGLDINNLRCITRMQDFIKKEIKK